MARTIGIDLGTTNSCVCVILDDQRIVIPNAEGSRTTPSVVGFAEDGQRFVGPIARRQAQTNAENTVSSVKRLIGRRFDSPDVKESVKASSYKIVSGPNGDAWINVRGREYSPAEISSILLREMKNIAEDYLGEEVTNSIITVPAYFDDAQRQATKDAGKIAGLNVLRIINEPTAAALAYGLANRQHDDIKLAVYDLGGGTFDISILELTDGVFSVLSTAGDTFLGGEDFDNLIIGWLAENFKKEHGIDLRDNKMTLQRLKEEAERAKCELSSIATTDISLPFIHVSGTSPVHLEAKLTRDVLEGLVEDLIVRTLKPCKRALADACISVDEIDKVLLVGGMTRMPRVREIAAKFFGKEADSTVNPDEIVAMGAAIQGGIVGGELTDVLLLDVTPLTMGIETMGGVFTPLISRNTTIPYSYTEVFSTARDMQEMVRVHILQGERSIASNNKSLAVFELTGIPPAPRGVPKIEVVFSIDESGIVSVSAKDLGTGREQRIEIVAAGGLNESDINRMIAEAEENEDSDRLNKEIIEQRNMALGILYSTERSLQEYGDMLGAEELVEIQQDVAMAKELIDGASLEELVTIIATLESAAYRLADAMYAAVDTGG